MSEAAAARCCAAHPERPATGACARCGAFFCIEERIILEGAGYCAACGTRSDVNWIEAYRLSVWGKRDGWAWVVGLASPLLILAALTMFIGIARNGFDATFALMAGAVLTTGALGCCFFAGLPWSRHVLLVALPFLGAAGLYASAGLGALVAGLIAVGAGLTIYRNGRNQLFFKVAMSEAKLKKTWDLFHNNTLARDGVTLALFGVAFPPAAPLAVVISAVAWSRVDPQAHPPIGRKWTAIGGLALGAIATLLWGGLRAPGWSASSTAEEYAADVGAPRFIAVDFETAYRQQPAWDIGRPQPALTALGEHVPGSVLDVGCGTGEHALFYAGRGHEAWGIDQVPAAIAAAQTKAGERGLSATFQVGDALALGELGRQFDLVIDSGLFHTLDDSARVSYCESLASVVKPGGAVHLLCLSDLEPGTFGPRRISQDELRHTFADGWVIEEIAAAIFEVNRSGRRQAWRAIIRKAEGHVQVTPRPAEARGAAQAAAQIEAEIEAVEYSAALGVEANFSGRAEALDRLEFHVIDRLRALDTRSAALSGLEERATRVAEQLAAIDHRLFQQVRAGIAEGSLRGDTLRRALRRYAGPSEASRLGYDHLDLFVDGLLRLDSMPSIPLRPREPEMVYYQPTPARIVLELLEVLPIPAAARFYDLGSGLGQVCILINLLTEARTVGIEVEPAYCTYAAASALRMKLDGVEFINGDARADGYRDGTVFFMYTPFRGAMMEQVLANIRRATPAGRIWICAYGTCVAQVGKQGWLTRVVQRGEGPEALGVFERPPSC